MAVGVHVSSRRGGGWEEQRRCWHRSLSSGLKVPLVSTMMDSSILIPHPYPQPLVTG